MRRLLMIYLPAVVVGMTAFFASFTLSLTANGLTVLSLLWVITWAVAAARDSSEC